jgi:hypothetical protein
LLAAAYEVDYLEGVVWQDFCFVPHCAWKDIQVVLDGYAVVTHFQKIQQSAHCKAVGDFARVAIYFYDHRDYGAGVADELDDSFGRERMTKRISSFPVSALAQITSAKSPFPSGGSGNWIRTRPCSSVVAEW